MLEVKHGHQVVIHRVHTAQRCFVVLHHGNAGFPPGVLFDFTLHTNPCTLVHTADFNFAIGFHLLIDLLLVVGDNVQFPFKFADSTKRAHMWLTILIGGEIKSTAGLQIFDCLIHCKNSFQSSGCVFFCLLV